MGSVNVLTDSGFVEIANIVRRRLRAQVACADTTTGRVEFRTVVGWSCTPADPADLVLVAAPARGETRHGRGQRRTIRAAYLQPVLGPGGFRPAGALRPGDPVYTHGTALAPWQEQFVLGTLLGNGYAGSRGRGRYSRLALVHGHSQRDYLRWKYDLLANLTLTPPAAVPLSPGGFAKLPTRRFATRTHPTLSALADTFYRTGVKRPPAGVVARAGWLGVGVWFGDDGGCVYSGEASRITRFCFHTNGFTPGEVDRLAAELQAFTGLPWRRYMHDGRYPILTLGSRDGAPCNQSQGNLARWVELSRPYVPPMLAYKLRVDSCGAAWEGLRPPQGLWLERVPVQSVGPYGPGRYEDDLRYHLTVAGRGNFVAHGVVVGDATVGAAAGFR
jgi:hypothetical protein